MNDFSWTTAPTRWTACFFVALGVLTMSAACSDEAPGTADPISSNNTSNGTSNTTTPNNTTSNTTNGTTNNTTNGTTDGTTANTTNGTTNGTTGGTTNGTTNGNPCDGVVCDDGEICINGSCFTDTCDNDDANTNETSAQATALAGADQTVEGTICAQDKDWYALTLSDGQDAIIDLVYTFGDGTDLDLALYADDGTTELQLSETASNDEQVVIPPVSGQTSFFLEVYGFLDDDENSYMLNIDVDPVGDVCRIDADCGPAGTCVEGLCEDDPPCASDNDCGMGEVCDMATQMCVLFECFADANENNNVFRDATALPSTDQSIEGTICDQDQDWFVFTLMPGQDAQVTVRFTHAQGDLDARVYLGSEDNEAGLARSEDDNERLGVPTVDEPTDVYIEIYGFPRNNVYPENSYTLDIDIDPEGFACNRNAQCTSGMCNVNTRLCVTECNDNGGCNNDEICDQGSCVLAACFNDPGEPNEELMGAYPIMEGVLDNLALCGSTDEDWFRITIFEDDTLFLATLLFDTDEADIEAQLINGEGQFEAFGNTSTDNEYLGARLDAGFYFLRVYVFNDRIATYTLDVELNPDRDICLDDDDCAGDQECTMELQCVGLPCLADRDCPFTAPICGLLEARCIACMDDIFDAAGSNDTADTATNINGNLDISQELNTCNGEDFYTFTASAGQTITIELLFEHDDGDLDMLLTWPNDADVTPAYSGDDNERIDLRATVSGTYTIRVFSLSAPPNEPDYATYNLRVNLQ